MEGSEPMLSNCFLTLGSARTSLIAVFSFFTMAGGMPFGPTIPAQVTISRYGAPACATVGTLGSSGERVGLVMARARMRPALICGSMEVRLPIIRWM